MSVKIGDQLWKLLDLSVFANPVRACNVRHVVLRVHAKSQAHDRRTWNAGPPKGGAQLALHLLLPGHSLQERRSGQRAAATPDRSHGSNAVAPA